MVTSKVSLTILSLLAWVLAACTHTAGTADLVATVHQGELTLPKGRTMSFLLWGPAARGTSKSVQARGNDIFLPVDAIKDAPFMPGRHPLVLLFHGTSGNADAMAWLSAALAREGALVLVANYPGYTTGEVTEETMMDVAGQARGGEQLLNWFLTTREGKSLVDPDRIITMGFSLGGFSALATLGVDLDIEKMRLFCQERPKSETCLLFGDKLFGALGNKWETPHLAFDKPVAAAVALAPGFIPAFRPEGVAAISQPVLVIGGTLDPVLPVKEHARSLAGAFENGTYAELTGATHFSFLGLCRPGAVELLAEDGAEFLCEDPKGVDRAQVHRRTPSLILGFLEAERLL